jgi:hypothetical protein
VPAAGGASEYTAFGSMLPESKALPSSAVTVWATAPVLVQTTVTPTLTLTSAGAYVHCWAGRKGGSTILTSGPAAGLGLDRVSESAVAADDGTTVAAGMAIVGGAVGLAARGGTQAARASVRLASSPVIHLTASDSECGRFGRTPGSACV